MIKRKPGRPRKVEQSVDGIVPEKRKPGRPRKIVIAGNVITATANSDLAEVFEYHIHVSTGYGESVRIVHAQIADISEGKLNLRRDGRIVAAFNSWDDFVEIRKPIQPPKVEITMQGSGGTAGVDDPSVSSSGGTGWGTTVGYGGQAGSCLGNASEFPKMFSASLTGSNGTCSGSGGEPYVLTTGGSASHIEIVEAERPND